MTEGQRVALVGVGISASLAVVKIVTGVFSGSNALLADGFESSGDVLASGLVWLGLTWAAKPADSNHPYGHGRAEMLSGLIVGLLLFCGGVAVTFTALFTAGSVSRVPAGYAVWPLFLSLGIKFWMVRLKWMTGQRIGSAALAADAMNDSVDMLSGIIALGALGLTLYDPAHFLRADHYGASVVGVIMVITGIRVARRTGSDLMDTMPEDAFVEQIRQVALGVEGVEGVEKVYARKTGLQHHVDIHLEVDPSMTVRASHELGHRVERAIVRRVASVAKALVHIEPSGKDGLPYRFSDHQPTKLPDVTRTLPELSVDREPFGEVRTYFEGCTDLLESMTAGSLVLAPGQSPHPPHQHPEEEFMLVAEGHGEITVGEEVRRVGPGAMMYCAGNKLHGIVNTGTVPLLFYFYKWLV